MITVTPRARRRDDRAGDPLDGLVNLFDLGIVLAVAFLLAALSSLHLTAALAKGNLSSATVPAIQISPGQTIHTLPTPGATAAGHGTQVGTVYQLPDGSLIYVTGPGVTAAPTGGATGAPGSTPTAAPTSPLGSVPTITPTTAPKIAPTTAPTSNS